MALATGNSGCTAGLSKRIYDAWVADSRMGLDPNPANWTAAQTDGLKAMAYGVAVAIVAEIVANGEAFITTSKSALQQSGGVDTTAPTAERSLPLR